ncbi:helix-turn-helix transcriptional regulator [Pedobacter paludis]|uniref:HTH luxR-type domain-containing protein n=1 Tax=Pedobacter paludis TaxID=2203212 RepID=A0A317F5X0_9SPHI|nr:hypothetical protein [Pedobacter paludis]PWS33299.1 hypothetical protein DF947_01350 [Pedobacter paludis]
MEKLLIKCLLQGMSQKEIAEKFQELEISPCSLSAVEKAIKCIKAKYGAKTMFHLGVKIARRKK